MSELENQALFFLTQLLASSLFFVFLSTLKKKEKK